jgi:hypothetical protein
MAAIGWKSFWQALPRCIGAGLTLVCYLATALNIPLPNPAASRSRGGAPFPCQDHSCGCQSAEQCWARCCCLTPEQRWSWARAHNAEPPAYAERPSNASWATTRLRDREKPAPAKKPCCGGDTPAPVAHSCLPHGPGSSLQPHGQTAPTPADESPPRTSKGPVRWVLTLAALRCQGHGTLWVTSGAALPLAAPLTWAPCLAAVGWLSESDQSAASNQTPPVAPPPRIAHS